MNELVEHWTFFEPDWYLTMLGQECLSKEILEIFAIARVLFSSQSLYSTKERLVSLLSRRQSPSTLLSENKVDSQATDSQKEFLSDYVNISKISSVHQISSILPREFIINDDETIFYKKLLNRELNRRQFEAPEEKVLSVSEFIHGQDTEVNKAQKVYLLFDNSSSMSGEGMNKFWVAKAIALEYLRQAQPENPQIYFRSFTDRVSSLMHTEKNNDLKKIIQHIAHLPTEDCHQTNIGQAILKAIEDIQADPRLEKAEILVVTDGMGAIPKNLRELLRKIKLHVILISGVDVEQIFKLYPDRATWEAGESEDRPREMPLFWELYGPDRHPLSLPDPQETIPSFQPSNKVSPEVKQMWQKRRFLLTLSQIYHLQEVVDTFITIPSLVGEKFNLFNPFELELIEDYREKLEGIKTQDLATKQKFEIYQRIQFVIKYLSNLLIKKPPKEIVKRIKLDIEIFNILSKVFSEDSWFIYNINTMRERGKEGERAAEMRRNKEQLSVSLAVEPKRSALILFLFVKRISQRVTAFGHLLWLSPKLYWKNLYHRAALSFKKRRLNKLKNKIQNSLGACRRI